MGDDVERGPEMIATEPTTRERVETWVRRVTDGLEQPQNGLYLCEEVSPSVPVEPIFFKTLRPDYLTERILEDSNARRRKDRV